MDFLFFMWQLYLLMAVGLATYLLPPVLVGLVVWGVVAMLRYRASYWDKPAAVWRCTRCERVGTSDDFVERGCGVPGNTSACPLEPAWS